ncbi:hypothetical protein [Amnibacterium kyonggiense]
MDDAGERGAQQGASRLVDIDPAADQDVVPSEVGKRANVLFTLGLERRYSAEGIHALAVHPGVIIGPGPHPDARLPFYLAQGLIDEHGQTVIDPETGKKTAEQGAATIAFAAASPLLDGIGGVYLKDNDIAPLDDTDRPMTATSIPADANSAMLDPSDAHLPLRGTPRRNRELIPVTLHGSATDRWDRSSGRRRRAERRTSPGSAARTPGTLGKLPVREVR